MKKNVCLILMLALLALIFVPPVNTTKISRAENSVSEVSDSANYFSSASAMIVIEQESGTIIAQKNAHERRRMASTTKILTAITAIESGADLEKIVLIPQKAVGIEGSSIYLRTGEQFTLKNLLYGLMLRSGNDAATAIAIEVGGSVEGFVKMMNDKAAEIGATNSCFTNPHGLDAENHYTTAADLAAITRHAMKNPVFREISSTQTARTNERENTAARLFYNKNKLLRMINGGIGVKTGFTKKAGRCLVSAAERDGLTFICVVLNCDPMFEESVTLLNNAFSEYKIFERIFDRTYGVDVAESAGEAYNAKAAIGEFKQLIKRVDEANFIVTETLREDLAAPLNIGASVGKITIKNGDETVFETDIVLTEEAPLREKTIDEIIKQLLE